MLYLYMKNFKYTEKKMRTASRAIYDLCTIAMAVAVITLCSWIAIPFHISFTLQTFAVFLISGCFPARISVPAVLIYIAVGIVGVPVFSGFNAGISAIMGPSGGFILSFPLCAFIISYFGRSKTAFSARYICFAVISLTVAYISGCLWYIYVFAHNSSTSIWAALNVCVFPFIIPDILKMLFSTLILNKLIPYLQRLPI